MNEGKKSRRRRSSSLLYQEPPESLEHMSDQSALPNENANWVNAKGEQAAFHWARHILVWDDVRTSPSKWMSGVAGMHWSIITERL